MALVIELEESHHTRVEGVLGVGSGQGLTGEIALDVLNFSGGGREGYALWSRQGIGLSNLRVSYREPYVLNSPLSGWGAVEMVARTGYVTHRFGGGVDISVGEGTRFFGGVAHRRVLPDSAGLGFYEGERMWSVESGVRFDRREGAVSGWQVGIRGEVGEVSDEIRRVQWGVDGAGVFAVGRRSVVAGRARAFWVDKRGDVPQSAGIWLGGRAVAAGLSGGDVLGDKCGVDQCGMAVVAGSESAAFCVYRCGKNWRRWRECMARVLRHWSFGKWTDGRGWDRLWFAAGREAWDRVWCMCVWSARFRDEWTNGRIDE